MSNKKRVATHAIDPQFIERWSPRAFTGEDIPEATLIVQEKISTGIAGLF